MTKKMYLQNLENELQALPLDERESALDYYMNYFDDAGSDNEAEVIEELGDVKQLAKSILVNESLLPQTIKKTQQTKSNAHSMAKEYKKSNKETNYKWFIVVLVIVAIPLWLPLVGSLLGAILTIGFTIFGLGLGGVIVAVVLGFLAIALIVGSFAFFATFPSGILFSLGLSILFIGLAILAWIFGVWFLTKFIPWCYRGLKSLWKKIFIGKEA